MSPVSPDHPCGAASADLRYQALFEQAPLSIQILAPGGRTLRVNQAWQTLWQIHAGTALYDFVFSDAYNVLTDPQLLASGIAPLLQRAFDGEAVTIPAARYDVAALGSGGPARWVTARAHPIRDAAGKVLEVMLMHEDITARVEQENALRLREERFRSLVMATSHIVWTCTAEGQVLEDSPSWRAYTGQHYAQWRNAGWLDAIHPDDRAAAEATWREAVRTGTMYEMRYRLRTGDGSYRWTAVKGVPILAADGAIREWMGANTDIHDRVMAELALAERDRRKDHFLAMLAHELRNPLAPITSAAQLLQLRPADAQQVLRSGRIIERQAGHLTALVDSLLDVSRVTHGLIELKRARLDPMTVVASAVEQMQPVIDAQRHSLVIDGDAGATLVDGDAVRLTQVLVNLLHNAVKYTAAGGSITLAIASTESTLTISVRDNGAGIDALLLPHVFDLFTQGDRSHDRVHGGLGVGLALVREIVALHGGQVRAQSDGPGQGSCFTIVLPAVA